MTNNSIIYIPSALVTSSGSSETPSIPGIYEVFDGGDFATIQAAIDQAVSDGYTSASNRASVLVYPKMGGWVGDIELKDGVNVLAGVAKNKDYSVIVVGQLQYSPQSSAGFADADLTISGLYVAAGTGKKALRMYGSNVGRILINNCYLSKTGDTNSVIKMEGATASRIEADQLDGNITSSAAGAIIYDIQSGIFQSYGSIAIGSAYAGSIFDVGATGVVQCVQCFANCATTNAINIAAGGALTLGSSSITNSQANSNGANLVSGSTLTSLSVLWNIPNGTGFCWKGVLGSVIIYSDNGFTANKKSSTAIGAGLIALPSAPTPT